MLYITKYENAKSSFGGMVRVKDIEALTYNAQFLTIVFSRPFSFSSTYNQFGNKVFVVGFLRLFRIISILNKSKSIYFHTVGNFIKLFPYSLMFRGVKFIDLHGAQPEEFSYSNSFCKYLIFSFFEKLAFKQCDVFIHVSRKMISHFENKYPDDSRVDLYVPIFSQNTNMETKYDLDKEYKLARKKLGLDGRDPVYLYSGGVQPWQKIDLVLSFVKKTLESGNCVIILSMQKEFFEDKLSEFRGCSRLIIESVAPGQLSDYYFAADYGIMFRDDHILNTVASPTKLSEYLFYGMIPVLSSRKVGDFVDFGIDYLDYNNQDLSNPVPSFKSVKNRDILIKAMLSSEKDNLRKLLNE